MRKLPENDPVRLLHMREAAEKAIVFTTGKNRSDFDNDELLQLGIVRLIEIIGEAASQITEETRARYSAIEWDAIIGMRNRVIHGYFKVAPDIIWNTVQIDLPALIAELNSTDDTSSSDVKD